MWGTKSKPMGNSKKLEAAIKKVLFYHLIYGENTNRGCRSQ
jgi:hypothetical protein